jgi:hypothetical protein
MLHLVTAGDTPNDVRAALTVGVKVIAVATEKNSINELVSSCATAASTHLREVRKHVAWAEKPPGTTGPTILAWIVIRRMPESGHRSGAFDLR